MSEGKLMKAVGLHLLTHPQMQALAVPQKYLNCISIYKAYGNKFFVSGLTFGASFSGYSREGEAEFRLHSSVCVGQTKGGPDKARGGHSFTGELPGHRQRSGGMHSGQRSSQLMSE